MEKNEKREGGKSTIDSIQGAVHNIKSKLNDIMCMKCNLPINDNCDLCNGHYLIDDQENTTKKDK